MIWLHKIKVKNKIIYKVFGLWNKNAQCEKLRKIKQEITSRDI